MSIDALISQLDDKDARWWLYRIGNGEWGVKIHDTVVRDPSLPAAIQKAAEYVPLPRVPRKPSLLCIDEWHIRKSGSRHWRAVKLNGDDFGAQFPSKKEAKACLERCAKMRREAVEEWKEKYGAIVIGKTEGVDFRWEDSP